jgi:hypothetical protein
MLPPKLHKHLEYTIAYQHLPEYYVLRQGNRMLIFRRILMFPDSTSVPIDYKETVLKQRIIGEIYGYGGRNINVFLIDNDLVVTYQMGRENEIAK